ncbi:hypothetical protein COOONC_03843 [Cooperia oncophora]
MPVFLVVTLHWAIGLLMTLPLCQPSLVVTYELKGEIGDFNISSVIGAFNLDIRRSVVNLFRRCFGCKEKNVSTTSIIVLPVSKSR